MWAFIVGKALPVIKKQVFRTIGVVCVLAVVGGGIYGIYRLIHPKPTTTNNTTITNPGSVTMDCSVQVSKAITETEDRLKTKEPKIKIKIWKICSLGIWED